MMNFKLNVLVDINSVLKPTMVSNKAEKEFHNQVSDLECGEEDLNKIDKEDYKSIKGSARRGTEKLITRLKAI